MTFVDAYPMLKNTNRSILKAPDCWRRCDLGPGCQSSFTCLNTQPAMAWQGISAAAHEAVKISSLNQDRVSASIERSLLPAHTPDNARLFGFLDGAS